MTTQTEWRKEDESSAFGVRDAAVKFEGSDRNHFHVEIARQGDDVIYHFWPPGDEQVFVPLFHRYLESTFKDTLPVGAEVYAHYTSLIENKAMLASGAGVVPLRDKDRKIALPRETFFVRVVGGMRYPLAEHFLKRLVLDRLEASLTH